MEKAERESKVRENLLRRMAERQGLNLRKSRRRDVRAIDYGCYMLVENETKCVIAGADHGRAEFSLDDVEAYLTQ